MAGLDLILNLLYDPNVAYLLLIVGIWCMVLAVTIPGIGLPETGAVVCLALSAIGLIHLQANLAGLGLIALALFLFILEFRLTSHGALLAGGTLALLIGSLLLFQIKEGQSGTAVLSWITVLLMTGVSTAGFAFFIYKGLGAQKLPITQNPDHVVGMAGIANTDINGEGAVYAGGEEWSASADEKIPAGSPVTVVGREGLRLKVIKAGSKT